MATSSSSSSFLPNVADVLHGLIPQTVDTEAVQQFTTSAPKQSIPVYYLPATATDTMRKNFRRVLTLCGRCTDPRPTCWQTFVLTWSVACFPELLQSFRNDATAVDYVYQEVDSAFLSEIEQAVEAQYSEDAAGEKFLAFPVGLPNAITVPLTADVVDAGTDEGLMAYYAMLVFLMGKSINADNISAISINRPSAIIRKRGLERCEYILKGDGKISPDSYRLIQSGWVRSTRHRITIVRHLARLASAPNRSELLDSVAVNMEMLKNAGQSYMYYIHELLVACPWCVEIPALTSAYYHYARMVNVLAAQPSWLRPYFKLMMQDASRDVRRRDIEALISVATFFAAQTRKTMNQYRVDEGTFPAVQAFKAKAAEHGIQFSEIQNQLTTDVSAA